MTTRKNRFSKWIGGSALFLLLVLLTAAALADVTIDETNFPDAVFRQYVKDYFDVKKPYGTLTRDEIVKAENINLYEQGVSDLKGVEHFPMLEMLEIAGNSLKELDLSKNTKLVYLSCDRNQLTKLDLSKNTLMTDISCFGNQLESLDVSPCTPLRSLHCHKNGMKTLTLGQNKALELLVCFDNQIASLDLKGCTALNSLTCYNNQLTSLDLSGVPGLTYLSCQNNALKTLDVSCCSKLEVLFCEDDGLTTLDLSKNQALQVLSCDSNSLTSLDLSQNPGLYYLTCYRNPFETLDISKCQALDQLVLNTAPVIGDNYLEFGDVSNWGNTAMLAPNTVKLITSQGLYILKVQKITLNHKKATLVRTSVTRKPTLQLTATITPSCATIQELKWESSNPAVATVSQNGKVKALKAGTATITCSATDGSGVKATCKITVKDRKITRITLNKKTATLKKGKTLQLKAKIKPATALNQKLKWTTSNKKVATVDKNGLVKAIRKGICEITCTALDGSGVTAICTITVK